MDDQGWPNETLPLPRLRRWEMPRCHITALELDKKHAAARDAVNMVATNIDTIQRELERIAPVKSEWQFMPERV